MTFSTVVIYAVLIGIRYILKGFLAIYITDGVLKYEIKHKRFMYILCMVLSFVVAEIWVIAHYHIDSPIPDLSIDDDFTIHAALTFLVLFFLKTKWWKTIFVAFSSLEILSAVEDIFIALRNQLDTFLRWPGSPAKTGIFIISSLMFFAMEFIFFYFLKRMRDQHDNMPLPLLSTVLVSAFISFFVLMMKDMYSVNIREFSRSITLIMALLMLLLLLALYFYIRVNRKERDDLKAANKINEQLVESQTKFFEATARSDNEIRAMRHDMRNNIQVLMLLHEKGEYDKMREYLTEMGDNLTSADVSAHTGDTIADAIIADKAAKAEECGVKLKCSGKIAGVEISPVDMCKILANLLDNAIEAASKPELKEIDLKEKIIDLQFKKTDNFFMISVTNPCFKAPKTKGGKIVTSKEDRKNHGFGLQNIETAAAGYDGELNFSCDEKPYGFLFRAEVVLPIAD